MAHGGGVEVQLYSFFNLRAGWGGCLTPRPGRFTRLGKPQGRSGRVRKSRPPPPGCDPRTVQPETSGYTDCAIPAYLRQ